VPVRHADPSILVLGLAALVAVGIAIAGGELLRALVLKAVAWLSLRHSMGRRIPADASRLARRGPRLH
jgi:hypothetical protein